MTDKPNNGGAAFPFDPQSQHTGMSLRDWFAGQRLAAGFDHAAVAGTASRLNMSPQKVEAVLAYEAADAMLEARK